MKYSMTEYNDEIAKRVYAEERIEEIVKNMIADNEPIEKIIKYTGLTRDEVDSLNV